MHLQNLLQVHFNFCVICTRFELVTSCLSSKRSKPTELTDLLSKAVAKITLFFGKATLFFNFKEFYLQKTHYQTYTTDKNKSFWGLEK